jgi:hypothetical protein
MKFLRLFVFRNAPLQGNFKETIERVQNYLPIVRSDKTMAQGLETRAILDKDS